MSLDNFSIFNRSDKITHSPPPHTPRGISAPPPHTPRGTSAPPPHTPRGTSAPPPHTLNSTNEPQLIPRDIYKKPSSTSQSKYRKANKYNCKSCAKPDNKKMVACDECDDWHHFQCVNVSSDVAKRDWSCPKCVAQQAVANNSTAPQKDLEHPKIPTTNDSSVPKDVALNVDAQSARDKNTRSTVMGSQSSRSSKKTIRIRLQRLEEERCLKEKRDKEYLDAKYDILEEQTESDIDSEAGSRTAKDRLSNWVSEQNNKMFFSGRQENTAEAVPVRPKLNIVQHKAEVDNFECGRVNQPTRPAPELSETWVGAKFPSIPITIKYTTNTRDHPPQTQSHNSTHKLVDNARMFHQSNCDNILPGNAPNLSSQQLATRHIVSKELPSFSGLPEEWPLFISCFETCGLSDYENLIRLQKSLKGRALEAVRARLMYPNQVQGIISTLRMLFGRTETIINSLIAKLRSERPPRAERLDSLVTFALSVQNIVATMESSALHAHLNNPCLLQELTEKLPYQTRLNWGIFKMGLETVDLSKFSAWLFQVAQAACEVTEMTSLPIPVTKTNRRQINSPFINNNHIPEVRNPNGQLSCVICGSSNCTSVEECDQFLGLSLKQRWDEIKKCYLCRTCLIRHPNKRCTSNKQCGINGCSYRHHRLLHKYRDATNQPPQNEVIHARMYAHQYEQASVLFKVVPVTLYNNGIKVDTYAFLDDGSSITLMDEELANILKLEGAQEQLCLRWTANTRRLEKQSRKVNLQISGSNCTRKYLLSSVRTVESLDLPSQSINSKTMKSQFPYFKDIPISSFFNVQPRILIGLDHANLIVSFKHREGKSDQPSAIKTRLGWTVFGPLDGITSERSEHGAYHMCECQEGSDEKLHELVRKFFAIENITSKNIKRLMNNEDTRAKTMLEEHTEQIGKRYSVPLLWKSELVELPDSRPAAVRRLVCLENRLKKEPALAANLQTQVQEYLRKGYVRKLTGIERRENGKERVWYLPIFPVINLNKPSKVRIVWDAAARVNEISLNSVLMSGPDDLPPLPEILFRFREKRIAICGDIREMFHKIMVRKSDQHAQRFLWRNIDSGEIEDYVMQVLTFGSTCSPYCASFIKNLNALKYASQFPRAVQAIVRNHYVDDFLDSVDTEEEAIRLANEVIHIHQQGGFEITNFMSNSSKLVEALGDRAAKGDKNIKCTDLYDAEKVLGMWWSPRTDVFSFSFLYKTKRFREGLFRDKLPPTKREVLKILMSVFDPLGLIAHFLVMLKILLQEVWRQKIQWDEELQDGQLIAWHQWTRLVPVVKEIRIKRPYFEDVVFGADCSVELHMFVDASLAAYAAVAYLRIQSGPYVECRLVCSRTRVGPLKPLSVPRMELEAAVLGVRLAKVVAKGHSIKINKRYFWSDSQAVLCWIKNEKRKMKQFVMFRIGEILEDSAEAEWRWVPSKDNVADDATKWNVKKDWSFESRWYSGPEFLRQSSDRWPAGEVIHSNSSAEKEVRMHTHRAFNVDPVVDYNRFSSWKRLRGTISWCYRWKRKKLISVNESLDAAANYLYRLCQSEAFSREVGLLQIANTIQSEPHLEKSNDLSNLSPYLDHNVVMRIKGRIDASEHVPFNCKRPIILPKTHQITWLIVQDFHQRYKHINFETTVNEIRQSYYIPSLRTVLKQVTRKCQTCKNARAIPVPPMMGELPPARLKAFTRPFSYVGMDYFGPMLVAVGRHSEKRWGVIFTCLTIRAIHIEVAHSLSSDTCIMAMQRFCARRGKPVEVWSDNGTNFRGASQELRDSLAHLDVDRIAANFVNERIKWNFIPPASPHMGGSWERLVRSVKQVLAQMNQPRNPKDEVLLTMMAEVEYIINSRPLTYVPLDRDSDEALTPNHFLMGSSNGVTLNCRNLDDGLALRRNWLTCEQYADTFWKRWVKEYLPTLTRRTKWFRPAKPMVEGDVVIIVDAKSPRSSWPKGRILRIHRSKDGQTRSAVIQTATGVYTRPTAKLAVLDVGGFGVDGNLDQDPRLPGGSVAKLGNAAVSSNDTQT